MTRAKRFFFVVLGLVSLALGGIGVFLPLLPTTPFILLAAFAFANSSDRLHQWLVEHNIFGPMITNWRRYRAISRRAKALSVLSMFAIVGISLLLNAPPFIIVVQALVLSASALFVLTRPVPPENSSGAKPNQARSR